MPTETKLHSSQPIHVLIVEDEEHVLHWLQQAILKSSDFKILGTAGTRAEGLSAIKGPAAQVLLVDLGLPDGSGIDVIQHAHAKWPDCAIMVITKFGDVENVMLSLQSGALTLPPKNVLLS